MEKEALLGSLANVTAPSGCESAAAAWIRDNLEKFCDEIDMDKAGNLIARISPKSGSPDGKLMLAAHMDECGFMIKNLDSDGRARLALLGNLDTRTLSGRRVSTVSGVQGIIGTKPVHAQSGDERSKPTPVDKLYIEFGAKDKAEAETLVQVGDYGTFEPKFIPLANGFYAGKALGGRSMCALLCELAEKIRNEKTDYRMRNEIFLVFSVKREIARAQFAIETAAFSIMPDRAILFDAVPSADFGDVRETAIGAKLGGGVVIAPADIGTIYDRELFAAAVDTAEKNIIRYQYPTSASGAAGEGKTVHKTASGIRTLSLGIPTRNLHSGAEIIQISDYEMTLALAYALVSKP